MKRTDRPWKDEFFPKDEFSHSSSFVLNFQRSLDRPAADCTRKNTNLHESQFTTNTIIYLREANQLRRRGYFTPFFCKIRLPTGDWRCNTKWTRYAATVRQSLFVRELLEESSSAWHFYLSTSAIPFPPPSGGVFIIVVGATGSHGRNRSTRRDSQSLTRRCTRKPLKAVRFCWPAIGAHRYVKMSRRFLMKPWSALGLRSSSLSSIDLWIVCTFVEVWKWSSVIQSDERSV